MKNISGIRDNQCYGCQACRNVCPQNCIEMKEDKNGFLVPVVDKKRCINCGLCRSTCPAKSSKSIKKSSVLKMYVANVKDSIIRSKSTSGGMFYPMAEKIIQGGGCVYGAAFNAEYEVIHICAEEMQDVERCMKSKYVQSDMNDCYRQIAAKSQKQKVLFTGTPCQVAALQQYPNVNKDNLILVDVICHGVPSPKLWKKYLAEKQKEYGEIESVLTRDKERYGSLQSETVIKFKNGKVYRNVLGKDCYMNAFMNGISLRDRCYNCKYKGNNHVSDITIADFSEVRKYINDADVMNGVSMLIINSPKGMDFIEQLKNKWDMREVNTKQPLIGDWTWGKSFPYSIKTPLFYDNCFRKNLTIEHSIKRAVIDAKSKKKDKLYRVERIKEKFFSYKGKINDFKLKHFL